MKDEQGSPYWLDGGGECPKKKNVLYFLFYLFNFQFFTNLITHHKCHEKQIVKSAPGIYDFDLKLISLGIF